jgi:ADP-ribose pyrophosphatase
MALPMKTSSSKPRRRVLGAGNYIRLVREGRWEYAERVVASGAVAIVAVTDDRDLVLVEQYRVPVGGPAIELPAGLIGDIPGESVADWGVIARRELLEETGFQARRMTRLTSGPMSAGFSSETVALYLARGLTRVHEGGGVDHEEIRVHVVSLAKVRNWLARKERAGFRIDQKIFAGLYFASQLSLSARQR